jgi:hypothetical protein
MACCHNTTEKLCATYKRQLIKTGIIVASLGISESISNDPPSPVVVQIGVVLQLVQPPTTFIIRRFQMLSEYLYALLMMRYRHNFLLLAILDTRYAERQKRYDSVILPHSSLTRCLKNIAESSRISVAAARSLNLIVASERTQRPPVCGENIKNSFHDCG